MFGGKEYQGYEGSFTLLLNANLESKYNDKLLPNLFIIKDIKIWNRVKKSYDFIDLYVLQGMFSGFTVKSKLTDLDYNKVDITHIKEKTFEKIWGIICLKWLVFNLFFCPNLCIYLPVKELGGYSGLSLCSKSLLSGKNGASECRDQQFNHWCK